jgi:serine/threonine protein kinase/Flp pilus assembly protein TadD
MSMLNCAEEAIFNAARRITPSDARRHYLQQACGDDAALRARVEALLRVHDEERSFLQAPAEVLRAAVAERPRDAATGTVLGPYKLLEQIGEGGFGIVFRAEQEQPVRRLVALKVLKPGMDSRSVLARFEAERQALALMDHPNIAKVFDAGTMEGHEWPAVGLGRPYFVMELVKGVPITRYCDDNRLTPRQRLELFVPVCQSVQHAHQKGIIHRDLKPSNVLVALYDGRPVPKVIDFGVAKATGSRLTERALSTECGAVVGTLEYMSPEQAELNSLDIDTRSDVYSLGVLLYELLTGTTPLERKSLQETAFLEVLRRIREEEPPRPSARLSTIAELPSVAANRGLEPKKLSGLVRGELDWIVMKALEKDRNRRYESANGLARDLERYLADEPVEACPPSATYRLRKFARKNRKLLATGAAFAAVLLLGGAVIAHQWIRLARAEREEAERAAAHAREQIKRGWEINAALNRARELREQARSAPGQGGNWAEAQAMARRAEALLEDRAAEPELASQVQDLVRELAEEQADRGLVARLEEIRLAQADVNAKEGRFYLEKALPEYRQAFTEYGLQAGAVAPADAAAVLQGRPPAVRGTLVAALDEWLDGARRQKATEAAWLEQVLAAADADAWRQRLRAARAGRDRAALVKLAREVDVGIQPPQALFLLDRALDACGAAADSVALLRRAQEAYPGDFWTNHNLGMALVVARQPQFDEAIRFLTAAVALRPESAGARLNLSLALHHRGRLSEAIVACRKALELKPDYAGAHHNFSIYLWEAGRLDESVAACRRAVEMKPDLAEAWCNLANTLRQQGNFAEALAAVKRGHEYGSRRPDWPHPSARWVQEYERLGKLAGRLPAVLRGETRPADATEWNVYALLCSDKRLYAAEARMRAGGLEADAKRADDLEGSYRFDAACAATQAGAGRGADAATTDGPERARWRKQAVAWLRDDLRAYARLLEAGKLRDRGPALQRLQFWQAHPSLAPLRDLAAVARLPADEREACKQLWAEVQALLTRARAPAQRPQ